MSPLRRPRPADRDDPHRLRVLGREGALHGEIALLRRRAVGQRRDPVRADVHPEDGNREREQPRDRDSERERRVPQDRGHDPAPEPSLGRVRASDVAADVRDPEPVDAVAPHAEQRGKQGQRGGNRRDPDEDRAEREAPHDRGRDDEHPEERDDERRAAEQHRAARGRARPRDRVLLLEPVRALLAVAGDDEERVVDPERETHPREHVDGEGRERELERDDRDQAERDDDREDRHQERDEPRDDRAEDEHEDDERDRQPEPELAALEILLRLLPEVVVDAAVAGDDGREAAAALLGEHVLHLLRAGVALDEERGERAVAVARDSDEPHVAHLAGRLERGEQRPARTPWPAGTATVYRGELMRITSPFSCAATCGNDLLDRVDRLLGLRLADHVRLRAQPVERRRDERHRDDNGNSPERERPARMRRARPCKPLGHRRPSLTRRYCS